jgi:RIO-like serine/threonine protein kinase
MKEEYIIMLDKTIIQKDKKDIINGIEKLIERYNFLKDKINNTSAYTDEETLRRLEYIKERKIVERILNQMNIQTFEIKSDWVEVEIN